MRPYQVHRTLLVWLLLLFPGSVWTHAILVKSSPARRAMLSKAPTKVDLWFSERVEVKFSQISVWDTARQRVDAQEIYVDPDHQQRLSVGLRDLAPGTYTVKFRVLSVDGHIVESEFSFIVRDRP